MRWVWWQWIEHCGGYDRADRNRDREHNHSDNTYRQYSDYAGERANQLPGRAAYDNPYDSNHATGYTSG